MGHLITPRYYLPYLLAYDLEYFTLDTYLLVSFTFSQMDNLSLPIVWNISLNNSNVRTSSLNRSKDKFNFAHQEAESRLQPGITTTQHVFTRQSSAHGPYHTAKAHPWRTPRLQKESIVSLPFSNVPWPWRFIRNDQCLAYCVHRPRSGCDILYLMANVYINDGNGLDIILSIAVCPKRAKSETI